MEKQALRILGLGVRQVWCDVDTTASPPMYTLLLRASSGEGLVAREGFFVFGCARATCERAGISTEAPFPSSYATSRLGSGLADDEAEARRTALGDYFEEVYKGFGLLTPAAKLAVAKALPFAALKEAAVRALEVVLDEARSPRPRTVPEPSSHPKDPLRMLQQATHPRVWVDAEDDDEFAVRIKSDGVTVVGAGGLAMFAAVHDRFGRGAGMPDFPERSAAHRLGFRPTAPQIEMRRAKLQTYMAAVVARFPDLDAAAQIAVVRDLGLEVEADVDDEDDELGAREKRLVPEDMHMAESAQSAVIQAAKKLGTAHSRRHKALVVVVRGLASSPSSYVAAEFDDEHQRTGKSIVGSAFVFPVEDREEAWRDKRLVVAACDERLAPFEPAQYAVVTDLRDFARGDDLVTSLHLNLVDANNLITGDQLQVDVGVVRTPVALECCGVAASAVVHYETLRSSKQSKNACCFSYFELPDQKWDTLGYYNVSDPANPFADNPTKFDIIRDAEDLDAVAPLGPGETVIEPWYRHPSDLAYHYSANLTSAFWTTFKGSSAAVRRTVWYRLVKHNIKPKKHFLLPPSGLFLAPDHHASSTTNGGGRRGAGPKFQSISRDAHLATKLLNTNGHS